MSVNRTSRELAERVEIEFQKRPNRFRRVTWCTALLAGFVSAAWLAFAFARGEYQIFEAGSLSTSHKMFENDCAKCHTTWGPLQRLVTLDDGIHSVDNAKCLACHDGPVHHENQVPAHQEISCAFCHREHQGKQDLSRTANVHCVLCHSDLKTTHGPAKTFARRIERFDSAGGPAGHPEFAVHRLWATNSEQTALDETHAARSVMSYFQRQGETAPRWQDRARIRFNHAAHLKAEYDAAGKLVYGLIGKDGKFTDLSRSCQTCHVPDSERRYMLPINYETHCAECHPLLFDNQSFPGKTVPHRKPEVVRGYLTELYTLRTLNGKKPNVQAQSEPVRRIPGRPFRPLLTADQAQSVNARVEAADRSAQKHAHTLFGYEAEGGCRYCHTVRQPLDVPNWQIEPPNIPARWMRHSRFRHDSHRLMSCTACHKDVANSKSTGDVLLPSIKLCFKCHDSKPTTVIATDSARRVGARTDCVECHDYHDRTGENFDGPFDVTLNRRDK